MGRCWENKIKIVGKIQSIETIIIKAEKIETVERIKKVWKMKNGGQTKNVSEELIVFTKHHRSRKLFS